MPWKWHVITFMPLTLNIRSSVLARIINGRRAATKEVASQGNCHEHSPLDFACFANPFGI